MTRRSLREELPALRFVYGLSWADIEAMPEAELLEHVKQLPKFVALLGRLTAEQTSQFLRGG